jgi:hypothetical protein
MEQSQGSVVIHFDGFSLLLIVTFSCLGYLVGWRRARATYTARLINDAAVFRRSRARFWRHG